jgi:hypothetical protein
VANALRRAKSSRVDEVALVISLTAGDSGLSRRGMGALLRLRRSQLQVIEQSRGALVRIQPAPKTPASRRNTPLLNLGNTCAESPLVGDYLSLFLLQLVADYPEQGEPLRAILHARRDGLDASSAVRALWHEDGRARMAGVAGSLNLDPALLAATLWVALKPLCEAVARAFTRHMEPTDGGTDCPICGGPPWARQGKQARCAICETTWQASFEHGLWQTSEGPQAKGARQVYHSKTGQRLVEFDKQLFKPAFHTGPMIELIRLLEAGA